MSASASITVLNSPRSPVRGFVPDSACDCHVHVFGPADRFPLAPTRRYTPPDATPGDYLKLRDHLPVSRTVLVQPSPYDEDNTCLLDGLKQLGQAARGVAVISPAANPAELRAMHEAGIRGTRINLSVTGKADAQQARDRITAAARTNKDLNWHLQLNIGSEIVVELADLLGRLEVPVVLDHFAGLRPGTPGYDAALAVVRSLLRSGRVWVKLSAPYRVSEAGTYQDIAETLAALVQANPDRVVWGSDWPHTGGTPDTRDPTTVQPYLSVDDGASLSQFIQVVGDEQLVQRILADNPAELYEF